MWFVDAENRQVIISRKRRGKYVQETVAKGKATSDVLAGFWLNVSRLWADPLPDPLTCLQKILRQAR
jgi:hypothetical protein